MKTKILALLTALVMLFGCTAAFGETATQTKGTATVKGFGGDITVTVTLNGADIASVEITGDGETAGIGQKIIDEWPNAFVEYNGIVDTYSGATFAGITRAAVIEAMREALANAGVNPDDYMREMGKEEETTDLIIETDIVIVGAGGAGMTAALTASDAGKGVLVLESQPAVGGNSVKSTGGMNAAKTVYQDANEFGESAGVEKTLKAAEAYADNAAITALAATVKEQWDAWQASPEGYFDSTELFALDTLFKHPGAYRSVVSASPSIWWGGAVVLNNEAAFKSAVAAGRAAPRVLVTVGGLEQSATAVAPPPGMSQAQFDDYIRRIRTIDNARELSGRLAAVKGADGYKAEFVDFGGETHVSVVSASIARSLRFALPPRP